ncbi:MAG: acetoacetate decarboxylase family protein [Xenococcaceae cyanobacterium]
MSYPPAPWNLKGFAVVTLNLIDLDRARSFVPAGLEIVSVLPGKTLGSVYISSYQSGSVLEYNELIIAAALVRNRSKKVGSWISHIYVDNSDSVAGGREIWGLPKEMAEFSWQDNSVTVRQENRHLCSLNYRQNFLSFLSLPQKLSGNSFGGLGSDLLWFQANFEAKVNLISTNLEIPPDSPFANLHVTQPFLSADLKELNLLAGIPENIGEKSPSYVAN